jgi:hypothetical protein
LLAQWHAYRDAMRHTDPPPSGLDYGALTVGPVVDGRADVTAEVAVTWWNTSGGYRSYTYVWRITTREDSGWRVSAVAAPAWCGGYIRADSCGNGR